MSPRKKLAVASDVPLALQLLSHNVIHMSSRKEVRYC